MSFEYELTENRYGKKLAVSFDYDADTVDRIKSLDWENTHRTWNPDEEAWLIDYTDESITEFELKLGTTVPGEYKPDQGYKGDIEIMVPDGYTWFFIQNANKEIDRLLNDAFSYFQPGAEYSKRYKHGMWDGYVRLYNTDNHGSSIGLLDRAVRLIEDLGYEVSVTIEGDRSGDPIDAEWNFPHDLRSYQEHAITEAVENKGGVISFPTGSGKTVVGMKLVHTIQQQAIVFVHTKELLYQWADEIEENLGVEPGLIGDGNWSEGPVTVAIMQTLLSRGTEDLGNYGIAIFDECHRTSAADTMHEIGMDIDVEWRFGLSATPWRRTSGEELKIEGAVGGVAAEVSAAYMIEEGFLARPEFEIIDPAEHGQQCTGAAGEDYQDVYRRCVEFDAIRNYTIAEKAASLADRGYKVLVNVDRVCQGRLLECALSDMSADAAAEKCGGRLDEHKAIMFRSAAAVINQDYSGAAFLSGSDGTDRRQDILEQFENGEINILVSTLIKEGVDIPSINAIVLAEGKKSDIAKIQTIGRALRPSNGDHAKIIDVRDRGPYLENHFEKRQAAFNEYYEQYGPGGDFEIEDDEPPERQDLTEPFTDEDEAQLAADLGIVDSPEDY